MELEPVTKERIEFTVRCNTPMASELVDWEIRGDGAASYLLARRQGSVFTSTRFKFNNRDEADYALEYIEKLGGILRPEKVVAAVNHIYFNKVEFKSGE